MGNQAKWVLNALGSSLDGQGSIGWLEFEDFRPSFWPNFQSFKIHHCGWFLLQLVRSRGGRSLKWSVLASLEHLEARERL